jgi:hypothetical protein
MAAAEFCGTKLHRICQDSLRALSRTDRLLYYSLGFGGAPQSFGKLTLPEIPTD